jgi:hypothetical protein
MNNVFTTHILLQAQDLREILGEVNTDDPGSYNHDPGAVFGKDLGTVRDIVEAATHQSIYVSLILVTMYNTSS